MLYAPSRGRRAPLVCGTLLLEQPFLLILHPVLLSMAAFLRLPIRVCLLKSRATHGPQYVAIPVLFLPCRTEIDSSGLTVGSLSRLRVSGVDLEAGCVRVWLPSYTAPLFLGGFTSFVFFIIKPHIRYSKESR